MHLARVPVSVAENFTKEYNAVYGLTLYNLLSVQLESYCTAYSM